MPTTSTLTARQRAHYRFLRQLNMSPRAAYRAALTFAGAR